MNEGTILSIVSISLYYNISSNCFQLFLTYAWFFFKINQEIADSLVDLAIADQHNHWTWIIILFKPLIGRMTGLPPAQLSSISDIISGYGSIYYTMHQFGNMRWTSKPSYDNDISLAIIQFFNFPDMHHPHNNQIWTCV